MEKTWIVFGFTVLYIAVTTHIGMWSLRKTKDTANFMTAKSQMSWWIIGILLMSEFIGPGATVGTAQGSFKYFGLIVILTTAWIIIQGKPALLENIPSVKWSLFEGVGYAQVIAWIIGNVGAVFSTQYVLQSVCSLPKPSDARKATILAGLMVFPIGFMSAVVGIFSKAIFPDIRTSWPCPPSSRSWTRGPWPWPPRP